MTATMIDAGGGDVAGTTPGSCSRRMVRFATAADGSPQCFPLIVVAGAAPGPTAVFIAGIHGDEYEGPLALWQLAEALDPGRLAGRVLIVPIANGAAFAAGTRTSPADGENLARIFPGRADGTLSHRLADALMRHVVRGADFLVDSHSGGVRLAFAPVAGFYEGGDVAGETARASLDLARAMGLRFLWRLPPVPGVLSYEAARRGIPVCGAEIGGRGHARAEDVADYLGAYLSVLAAKGMIDVAHRRPPTSACLDGDWQTTPEGGLLQTVVALGAEVAAGELVARLRHPLGDIIRDFTAPFDGRVMAVRHLNSVQPGDLATCVVRESVR
jgi:predicted deacylase